MMDLEIVASRRDTGGSSRHRRSLQPAMSLATALLHPIPSSPARRKELEASNRKLELKSRLQM
jgi:hypothetical protein